MGFSVYLDKSKVAVPCSVQEKLKLKPSRLIELLSASIVIKDNSDVQYTDKFFYNKETETIYVVADLGNVKVLTDSYRANQSMWFSRWKRKNSEKMRKYKFENDKGDGSYEREG